VSQGSGRDDERAGCRGAGEIAVLTPEGGDEMEGICCAPLIAPTGEQVWIHAILLENRDVSLDNIFIKQWACTRPEVV
jgi:hypothetical protein